MKRPAAFYQRFFFQPIAALGKRLLGGQGHGWGGLCEPPSQPAHHPQTLSQTRRLTMPLIGTADLDRNRAAVSVPAAQTPGGQTETLIPAVTLVDEAGAAFTAGTVIDDDGNAFNPDSLPQALTYNGDDTVATITATDGADSWVQTYTWTSGNLTGVSQWVKQ